MANIGSFTTLDDGFTGTLRTLTLQKNQGRHRSQRQEQSQRTGLPHPGR